ncbi:FecR domain-containing protein [Roseospira navarrensis]|uniref:FecR protein domain-containing protein n=1 Tax=Roseospira navarrensis TaxID=140058 RepID=A0A7X1ZHH2_9PROT|nr:FecR domain-containing protein [Roseospira navarrensis]MQX37577.1 hypothetical protein [Roseospira navarrensis]
MSDRAGWRRRQMLRAAGCGLGLAALMAGGLGVALPAGAQTAQDPAGFVSAFSGRASLTNENGVRTLQTGMAIYHGDHVVTGEGARATVRLDSGVVVTAGATSDMQIAANTASSYGWRSMVRVRAGIVRVEFSPDTPVDGVTVETDTAHVNTQYGHAVIEVSPMLTRVVATEGRILVSGADGPERSVAVLGPGKGVDVARLQRAYDPMPWPTGLIQSFVQRTAYR